MGFRSLGFAEHKVLGRGSSQIPGLWPRVLGCRALKAVLGPRPSSRGSAPIRPIPSSTPWLPKVWRSQDVSWFRRRLVLPAGLDDTCDFRLLRRMFC